MFEWGYNLLLTTNTFEFYSLTQHKAALSTELTYFVLQSRGLLSVFSLLNTSLSLLLNCPIAMGAWAQGLGSAEQPPSLLFHHSHTWGRGQPCLWLR